MTHNTLMEMLEETALPIAYDHFAEGESPDPPWRFVRIMERRNEKSQIGSAGL